MKTKRLLLCFNLYLSSTVDRKSKGDRIMNTMRPVLCFAVIATMALAGCGGGGGGSSPMTGMPPTQPPPAERAPSQLTESQLYGDIDTYRNVATNSPAFGSITQSSISTDRVETTLDANGN